jgi:hypothetical protein
MRVCHRIVLFCLAALAVSTDAAATISQAEWQTLVNIYNSTGGASWVNKTNWNGGGTVPNGTECTWFGVTCNATGDAVTKLIMYNNNMTGPLPDLSGLSNLTDISLSGNHLTGSLVGLSALTHLKNLVAGYNPFSGPVPDLSALVSLQDVDLQQAGFSGPLPLLPASLQSLALSSNAMTGDLSGIEGLPNLQTFNGSNNQFSGSLPDFSTMPSLNYFSVINNQFTGTIPSLAGHNFSALIVSRNQLTGVVPDLSAQTFLFLLEVDNNFLSGSIPSLAGLNGLGIFYVYNNRFTGVLPSPPSPNSLSSTFVDLCPNTFAPTDDPQWDAIVGTPWYSTCDTDTIFGNGLGSPPTLQ